MLSIRTAGLIGACFVVAFVQGSLGVEFEETPREAVATSGSPVLIRCNAVTTVTGCQWYWVSLAGDDSAERTQPVIVSTFPAYGADNRSCSVRFKAVRLQQQGLWICGVREGEDGNYVMAPPFKLTVVEPVTTTTTSTTPPPIVEFAELSKDHVVKVGMPMHLICKTAGAVDECLWWWRSAAETEPEIPVKKVEPFGEKSLNCDIRFDHVVERHDGIWTCGAKLRSQENYTRAQPIRVKIQTEVGFVQLTQDIQVAFGEPVLLRCVTNMPVDQCQWTWQGIGRSNNETLDVVKRFPPYGDERRDCSVRFKSVLEEHAGAWTCEARLDADSDFNSAPSANLTILYPAKTAFTDDPQDTSAVLGDPVTLKCVTALPVEECSWSWRPDHDNYTSPLLVKTFPPFDNASRDCSVRFKAVLQEQQGIWGCHVRGPATNNTIASRLARLTIYEKGIVEFEQMTQQILIYPGGPLTLRCTTSLKVDVCRWTWQPFEETSSFEKPKIFRQFTPVDAAGRDCTIRLWNVKREQRGVWTCGIKQHQETEFHLAPPTTVKVMQPESVTVALWTTSESSVSLACRLTSPQQEAACRWFHPSRDVNVSEHNHTTRYAVHHAKNTGVCTLTFPPGPQDLGQWTCAFSVRTDAGDWEMASANLILLTTASPGFTVSEDKMGWLIGVLAMMVLVLTGTLVALSICKCQPATEGGVDGIGGLSGSQGSASSASQDKTRYTDTPTKIDFQFGDQATATRSLNRRPDAEMVLPTPQGHSDSHHIYEKVGRCVPPTTTFKSIYENVD